MSWVPVEDGIVHDARNCDRLVVARGGSELVTWQNSDGHVAKLHEKLRLCRQVPDQASVPVLTDTTREVIEVMVDDWLERYKPSENEWADAQMIRAWLDNYSGTMYTEMKAEATDDLATS